ncbi:hypothetical protein ScPMuIL_008107 [Solemya velum]
MTRLTVEVAVFILFIVVDINLADTLYFQGKPFPEGLSIYGRNLTCGEHKQREFVSETWTCMDMRVNKVRMAYGYYPSIGDDNKCTETRGNNEIAELCRSVMETLGVEKQLWAAYVNKASCDLLRENRVMLNMTVGLDSHHKEYFWEDMSPGYGWLHTLQCMAVR